MNHMVGCFKPLHCRVADACVGDVGWVWWMGEWCPARILEDGDDTFCVVLMPDGSEWLPVGASDSDPVACMPWFEVSQPTYELDGDPTSVTHTLTYRDGDG
ncbi:MAG: hypothetical protein ABFD96_24990, partial [Armatimonadia bacterium]